MEPRMLEAAAALLSAHHALPMDGISTSVSGASAGSSAASAPTVAWPTAPSGYTNEHAFAHAVAQYHEGTLSLSSQPMESTMQQWSYPVGYVREEASADQRSVRAHGMNAQPPHEIVLEQQERQRQQLIHRQLQQQQQQQYLLQQRLYQQQQQHDQRQQQLNGHQHLPLRELLPQHQERRAQDSQHPQQPQRSKQSQQLQLPPQQCESSQQRQQQQKNEKRPRQKQRKSNQKRKTQSNQRRDIDDIVARAEQQPEFARLQYTAQLEQTPAISQDDALARRSASAVIRPGQSIVPQPYQCRSVETDARLKAISRMPGIFLGNGTQNARPLPSAQSMAVPGVNAAAAASRMNQRFPRPSFPSTNEQCKLSEGVWPHRHQALSHRGPQLLQTRQETLFPNLQPPRVQQQQQVDPRPQRRLLPDLDRSISRSYDRTQSEQSNDKRNPQVPKNLHVQGQEQWSHVCHVVPPSHVAQVQGYDSSMQSTPAMQPERGSVGPLTSTQHYYMMPPHQEQRFERRFEDAMWKDPEQHSAAASQVDLSLQRKDNLTLRGLTTETAEYPTSVNHNSLSPSLGIWTGKESDWYYPSAASTKTTTSQKIKNPTGFKSNANLAALQSDLKQLDQGTTGFVASGSVQPAGMLTAGETTTSGRPTGSSTTNVLSAEVSCLPRSSVGEAKAHGSALPGKSISNNRLRKMEKQNRRHQRREMAKDGTGKQLDAVQVAQQQSLLVERLRDQLQQGSKQPRIDQPYRQVRQPPLQPIDRQQQRVPNERQREVNFAMRSTAGSTTSSSQPRTKARHTDSRGKLGLQQTALQREQEQLLRRAQLVMVAQQQLHQRNQCDFPPHARPLPTVVARSVTASMALAVHKRSRGEYEQQNARVQSSSPVGRSNQPPISLHGENGADERSCQPDGSETAKFEEIPFGRREKTNTSDAQITPAAERAYDREVSRTPAPIAADARSQLCGGHDTAVSKANHALRSEKPAKSRKRKASSLVSVVATVTDTGASAADTTLLPLDTNVVVPVSDSSRPETETVMIFCKRDFMRFQAGLLWKKYQEIKRKRDQTLATVTGRRARYLNARYKNDEDEGAEVEGSRKRIPKRVSRSSTSEGTSGDPDPVQGVEVFDDEERGNSGVNMGIGSDRRGYTHQANPREGDVTVSLQGVSGGSGNCGTTFSDGTADDHDAQAPLAVAPSDIGENGSVSGDVLTEAHMVGCPSGDDIPEMGTVGESILSKPADVDSGEKQVQPCESQVETPFLETNRGTTADAPAILPFQMAPVPTLTATFQIVTMPVSTPVSRNEMGRGTDSKTNEKMTESESGGIVFREECVI